MHRILILDDREDYLRALRGALGTEFEVVIAATAGDAERALNGSLRAALVDVRLSEADEFNREGLTFLRVARKLYPQVPILMMSAYRDFDAAVEAVNLGADWFLKKPIDLRELRSLLREFSENGRMPERTDQLRRHLESEP